MLIMKRANVEGRLRFFFFFWFLWVCFFWVVFFPPAGLEGLGNQIPPPPPPPFSWGNFLFSPSSALLPSFLKFLFFPRESRMGCLRHSSPSRQPRPRHRGAGAPLLLPSRRHSPWIPPFFFLCHISAIFFLELFSPLLFRISTPSDH